MKRFSLFRGNLVAHPNSPLSCPINVRGISMSFKTGDQFEKPRVLRSNARIFHYGWVRPPEVMREKTVAMDKLYHGDGAGTGENYKYKRIYGLERFTGTHPAVMRARVEEKRWKVDLMAAPLVWEWKDARKVLSRNIEKLTGWLPFQYKNYEVVE